MLETIVRRDGAHGQVVGHNDTVEAQRVAEQGGDAGGERRREARGVELPVHYVGGHHHQPVGRQVAIGHKFAALPCGGHVDQTPMRVAVRTPVAGEMFHATHHSPTPLRVDPQAAETGHLVCVGRETALDGTNHRAGRVDVDIGHRGEIEIEAYGG